MITIRRSSDRGALNFGWLDTKHTFSFGDYRDPAWTHFSVLRVINEDIVAPGAGFPEHPHRDMEIITYMIDGALAHKDSTGGESVIRRGDIQRMTAGMGVTHSEFNPSENERAYLLQIWLFPSQKSLKPGYEEKHFPLDDRRDQLVTLVSSDGRDGSLSMHQDATLLGTVLSAGKTVTHDLAPGRSAWVQLVTGGARVNGEELSAGDGVGVTEESSVVIEAVDETELLLFDLP